MTNEIVVEPASLSFEHLLPKDAAALVEAFLQSRSEATRRAYRTDLAAFARYGGDENVGDAVEKLFRAGRGGANAIVLAYRTAMRRARSNNSSNDHRGLSASTINRRLAAIRSCVKLGRTLGLIDFEIDIDGLKVEPYRDTRGPGAKKIRKMLSRVERARDRAFMRLLYDIALRRGEVNRLDLEDYDREGKRLQILGKGRHAKEWGSLPDQTIAALDAWIAVRGPRRGALFIALDRAHHGVRLSTTSIYRIVRAAGERVGARARPHGLRHSAITSALDATNGNN